MGGRCHSQDWRKTSHDLEPHLHGDGGDAREVGGPAEREIGRDARGAFPFGKAGEELEGAPHLRCGVTVPPAPRSGFCSSR